MKIFAILSGLVAVFWASAPVAGQNPTARQSSVEQHYWCVLPSGKSASPPNKRGFFIGPARFEPKDILFAEVDYDQHSNEPVVMVGFTKKAANRIRYLTTKTVGQHLPIFLNGDLVTCPRVNEPIDGGQIQISGAFSLKEAKLLAAKIGRGPK